MPILNRDDAVEVETRIASIFAANPAGRANAIRSLFVETLDFDPASGQVSLAGGPANTLLPDAAERVAVLDGVHVLYVGLDSESTDRVRKAEVDAAARLIADQLGDELLLVFTNPSASQLHLILPRFEGTRPTLRRMVVERDLPQRTAVERVATIFWKHRDIGIISAALTEAFDVEPVTKDFFAEYKRIFENAMGTVAGFGDGDDEDKRVFVQTLFNRLMFVYFLSRKGWLRFDGDADYLNALWKDFPSLPGDDNFYNARLKPLFFAGLNNPQSIDLMHNNPALYRTIKDVKFLNGGLFEETELDRRDSIAVPDEAIRQVLAGLFDRFNFTVMESTPFDIEVAVDPEMLGKVFEELVTGRHDSGAYYTPRPVVSFMCRESLKGYLEGQDSGLASETIARFVDHHETEGIRVAQARRVAEALAEVTVVDPACGSGAYLLGMMQELIELQVRLFNVTQDAKSLYDLKLEIIQRNLYGVDIDPFAANIAMLRMWLSLAIDFEGATPEPLPNLDFKVVCGDSLLGPDPSSGAEVQGELGYNQEKVQLLGRLKGEFLREYDGTKKGSLRSEIAGLNAEIRESLGAAADDEILNWRVEFAEVFGGGRGFDIAIANPPYVHLRRLDSEQRRVYDNVGFRTLARMGDIYQLFYERGCQLLRSEGGILTYITSNSWLKAEYGRRLRRYFVQNHTPLLLLELGKEVFESAIVDSSVLMLRTGGNAKPFRAVDMDQARSADIPPSDGLWGQVYPEGESAWSVMSLTEQNILDKMKSIGILLKDWDIKIQVGFFTGLNSAFFIDSDVREELIATDPKSADLIEPVLRGRDIRRFRAEWAGVWLLYVHRSVGEHDYPAIRQHLIAHKDALLKRRGGANPQTGEVAYEWWQLQVDYYNSGAYQEHTKEKLVWIELVEDGRFAYDDRGLYGDASTYVMTGPSLKYLCAVLNSTLICWILRHIAPTSGMGTLRWKKGYVERIPIPKISTAKQRPFVRLVDRILEAKAADTDADTSELEREIDRLVYALYGLTEEETTAVERALGLIHQTDEEEDAALLKIVEESGPYGPEDFVTEEEVRRTLRAIDGC